MRILQFCHKSPFPPIEGGPIAVNNITQGLLNAGHTVKIFTISTPKFSVKIEDIPADYLDKIGFESVHIDTTVHSFKAFINLFSERSYNIQRFDSYKVRHKLIEILKKEEFDIIQLESLFVTPYLDTIREYSNAKVILRAHNIEYLVWERLSNTTGNFLQKHYLRLLSEKLKRYELSMLNKYDGIATITRNDAMKFLKEGCKIPVTDIPFGIFPENYFSENADPEYPSLFFLGSMDWMPNYEGIIWFLKNVWPSILKANPSLHLYIAGRNFPKWLKKTHYPNAKIVGEVKDAAEFMNSKGIMIAPLLSGSGIRVKIIEAMALGKTVISTSIGAEGINYTNGVDILIANSPDEFVKHIREYGTSRDKCIMIGQKAKELVRTDHNNKLIIQRLENFYNKIRSK